MCTHLASCHRWYIDCTGNDQVSDHCYIKTYSLYIYIAELEVSPKNIMLSHNSEVTQPASHSSETYTHAGNMQDEDMDDQVIIQGQPWLGRQRVYHSPIMLSDPLDSPSSDAKSFDEEDMYGSDSDVETVSLKQPGQGLSSTSHELLVCPVTLTLC